MIRVVPPSDEFPDGFLAPFARLVLEFGQLEYLIKLRFKDMHGRGFSEGMIKAESQGQFTDLCKYAKQLGSRSSPRKERPRRRSRRKWFTKDRGARLAAGHQRRTAVGGRRTGSPKGRSPRSERSEAQGHTGKRESELKAEIENLTDAIASGALKSSPALASRLTKAEKELAGLEAQKLAPKAAKLIPVIADEYGVWVRELETVMSPDGIARGLVSDCDVARARAQLKKRLGGHIVVTEGESEIRFQTEASAEEMALRLAGSGSQVFMVAGA